MKDKEHRFSIGRSRDCDIVLSDDTVSRQHAELTFLPGGKLLITDCHSKYGTALVGPRDRIQPVHQELIAPTDTLQFGDARLAVKELLEAIRLKFPTFYQGWSIPPAAPAPPPKPWVRDRQVVRCACGAVKPKAGPCPECGQP